MTHGTWPIEPVVIWGHDRRYQARRITVRMQRPRPRLTFRVVAVPLLGLALLAGLLAAPRVLAPPSRTVPAELVGVWVSDDPRYAGRALELAPGFVTIHTGNGVAAPHRVRAVAAREGDAGEVVYLIEYLETRGAGQVTVRLRSAAGELRLKRPEDVIWRRGQRTVAY